MGWLAKFRVCLITTAALIIIAVAVAFSVLRAVLPHATGYLAEVQQELEKQLGLPVQIASMDADMYWLVPRLKLLDVRIFSADAKTELVRFEAATFAISYLDSLRYMSPMIGDISLSGADLSLERDAQGHWRLQGVPITASDSEKTSDEFINLLNNTNFSLLSSNLHVRDLTHALDDMDFQNINVQVENLLGTHSLQARLDLPERYGQSLQVIAEISGDLSKLDSARAEIYLNARMLQLGPVFDKLGLEDSINASGITDTELWIGVENRQLKQVKARTAISGFDFRRPGQSQGWKAELASANIFWQQYADAWRLDVSDLMLQRDGVQWARAGKLLLRQNLSSGYQVSASYVRPEDLVGLLQLLPDAQRPALLDQYCALALQGDIYNLNIALPPGDKAFSADALAMSAEFHNLGFSLSEPALALAGFDGRLDYREHRLELLLASEGARVSPGELFRQPLMLQTLDAELSASRDNQQWTIRANQVRMKNQDIDTRSRVSVVYQADQALYLDMQTDFHDGDGAAAPKYYPTTLSETTISWLETALSGGRVDSGSFIFRGNVGDFPFEDNQGVMEVAFRPVDVRLAFLPDWPAIEGLSASVRFHNKSMTIERASAHVYQGTLRNLSANIADLNSIMLTIHGDIEAPAENVQRYIWNSGLDSVLGNAMRQFELSGPVDIRLGLEIPLGEEHVDVKTEGRVRFSDNALNFPAMQYQFTGLTGELDFTGESLKAERLDAVFDGAPVRIRATTVKSPRTEAVFNIDGRLPVDSLLARFQWLPENWLSGSTDWDVAVHVPFSADSDVRVSVSSPLTGVAIAVSDRLKKPEKTSLPLQLDIKLLGEAMQISANAPEVFDLFANRDENSRWHSMIDAPWLKGELEFSESLAPDSVIDMNFEYADLYSLLRTQQDETGTGGLKPETIPSLVFHADKLDWDAWKLNKVALKTLHHSHGMFIEKFDVSGRSMKITGKGSWLSSWQRPQETNIKLKVSSDNLGEALTALGYPRSVDRGQLEANIDWQWLAEPYRFSLAAVSGVASFELKDGAMLDVKPGAGGRLLGLLNVLHLPRRLLLDFGDVYKEGFVFDTIRGDMAFADGNASTRNVRIEAASANIRMQGRIGLVAEDYDMEMEVRPNSSAATFTGGTLAGGPVVGAGLVLLEKLLGVDKLAREKYSITGKWDDPVIEQTEKIKPQDDKNENTDS